MRPQALRARDFVSPLARIHPSGERDAPWSLAQIAGRFVELSGTGPTAYLTAAFGLVLDSQLQGEPSAWITRPQSTFYPPDVVAVGVDLRALVVVRAPDGLSLPRAALQLVRSGAFGLIVMDLTAREPAVRLQSIPAPLQTRLVGLAQKHETAIVVLTEKTADRPSLDSLVSLRADVRREQIHPRAPSAHPIPARYEVRLHIIKDKRRGPGRTHREICHGPPGLC
jgi:recombination protein RecA